MKKIIAICLVVILAATAVIGGTLAYFTDTDSKTNTFTIGDVDIVLSEPMWDEQGSKDAEGVYAKEPLAKDPTVTNNGVNPCFVRIKVTGLDCLNEYGAGDIVIRNAAYVEGAVNEGWTLHTDGYIYYNTVLDINTATTKPAFSHIVIPADLENLPENATNSFDVVVTAQAVQAQGADPSWANVQKMTVEQIAAWFTTCGMPEVTG